MKINTNTQFSKVYHLVTNYVRQEMISDYIYETNRHLDFDERVDEDSFDGDELLATLILEKFEDRCVAYSKMSDAEKAVKGKITFEDYCARIGLTINDVVETIAYLTDDEYDPDTRCSIPCETFEVFMGLTIEPGFHRLFAEYSVSDMERSSAAAWSGCVSSY